MFNFCSRLALAGIGIFLAPHASASYHATFKVGYGCDGSPSTGMRVSIPAGFNGALATPYKSHRKTYTEGVVEIHWPTNASENALPADFYDEFMLRGTTPAPSGPPWFKVVQTCAKGVNAGIEVPSSGTSAQGLKNPAALLGVLDIQATDHAH